MKAYADSNGLSVSALYEAKSRFKRRGLLGAPLAPGRFARVEPERGNRAPTLCRVRLSNGTAVEVACEPSHWPALFASVAALP